MTYAKLLRNMSSTFCIKSKLKQIILKAKPDTCTFHRAQLNQLFVCMTVALRTLKFYEAEKHKISPNAVRGVL